MAHKSHLKWLLLAFFPQILEGVGPINGTLSFYKCGFIVGDIIRWWGHLNTTLCKIIC